ncbi:MAG: hypothetical protein PG979_000495 [Rickettsia asembonensis]|nr:MAG: hypothetical protein PG979_000495 [Rickettsia asembonensis]
MLSSCGFLELKYPLDIFKFLCNFLIIDKVRGLLLLRISDTLLLEPMLFSKSFLESPSCSILKLIASIGSGASIL